MPNMESKRNVGIASGFIDLCNPMPCPTFLFDAMFGIKKLTYFHVGNGLMVSIVHIHRVNS